MLKYAFDIGMRAAYKEAGMAKEAGLLGGLGGLGKRLTSGLSAASRNPAASKVMDFAVKNPMAASALGGAGIGGLAGAVGGDEGGFLRGAMMGAGLGAGGMAGLGAGGRVALERLVAAKRGLMAPGARRLLPAARETLKSRAPRVLGGLTGGALGAGVLGSMLVPGRQ